jgi:serine protease Do
MDYRILKIKMKLIFVSVIMPLILVLWFKISSAQWPEKLSELSKSICIIEYYESDIETNEIKDQARFKRKITGILVNSEGLILTSDIIFPANLDIISNNPYLSMIQKPPEDITVSFERDQKIKARLLGKDDELRLVFLQLENLENLPPPVVFDTIFVHSVGDIIYIIEHVNGLLNYEKIITENHINSIIKKPILKLITTGKFQSLSPGGLVVNHNGIPIGTVYPEGDYLPFISEMDVKSNLIEILPAKNFLRLIKAPPELTFQKEHRGKSWLGIRMQILKKEMAAYWGIENLSGGIIVNSIVPGSPAEKAGLKIGDIIGSVGDLTIVNDDKRNLEVFRNYIRKIPENEEMNMVLYRKGNKKTVKIAFTSAPKSQFLAEEFSEENIGIRVKELTQDIIIQNDLDFDTEGIWVSGVEEAGPASIAGLKVNDLIIKINNTDIKDIVDFKKAMDKQLGSGLEYIQILINRDSQTYFIFIKTQFYSDE